MTESKLVQEAQTLKRFFEFYCKDNKHPNQELTISTCQLGTFSCSLELTLCSECKRTITYALLRLQTCEKHPKPKCRECPTPCYEKDMWKKMAKVMRYSGMRLGLIKVKERFVELFQGKIK
jgi:predicted amidophosphoribosyltransferase